MQVSQPARIGLENRGSGQRHFVPGKQWRRVHIVLDKSAAQHHITNAHALRDAAGDTGKQHSANAKPLDQRSRGGRCCNLADTRQREHHRLSEQQPAVKLAPGMPHAGASLKLFEQTRLLLCQSAQNGKRRVHGVGKRYLSRNSRRKIFPTGVLGKSLRNSISFGCL